MDSINLTVNKRAPEEKANLLRKAGEIPGVIYGSKTQNTSIKCKRRDLHLVYVKAGESTLVDVELDGKKVPSLIHAMSFEPVTGDYEHVDFFAVDMTKEVTAHVPIVLVGESLAVKDLGGVLVTVHDSVTVTCLPKDLPHSLSLNISSLVALRDTITVKSLPLPAGVTVEEAPDTVLITIQEPRQEEVTVVATPVEGQAAAGGTESAATSSPAAAAAPAEKGKKEEKKK